MSSLVTMRNRYHSIIAGHCGGGTGRSIFGRQSCGIDSHRGTRMVVSSSSSSWTSSVSRLSTSSSSMMMGTIRKKKKMTVLIEEGWVSGSRRSRRWSTSSRPPTSVGRAEAATTESSPATSITSNTGFSFSSMVWKPKPYEPVNEVDRIARSVGVRLTPNELKVLKKKLQLDTCDAETSARRIDQEGQRALREKTTREICLSVVLSNINPLDRIGVRVISFFDYAGTALFAVVGCQIAGDCAGMNLVGCTLVGCAAALGGGSVNAVLYGGASPLLALNPGVRWVANPSYLFVAVAASVITFYAWPYYCRTSAERYIETVIGGRDELNTGHAISKTLFMQTWRSDPSFRKTIQDAMPRKMVEATGTDTDNVDGGNDDDHDDGARYFAALDKDESGDIDVDDLRALVKHRFYQGWETYVLETLGLSSLSIAAVGSSIRLGLNPFVAATSGVTICFGGMLRDVLCDRDIAVGSQSYAVATGASSATYVLLRELCIHRIIMLPLSIRTFLSAGMCVSIRAYEYYLGRPLLSPMHGGTVGGDGKDTTKKRS